MGRACGAGKLRHPTREMAEAHLASVKAKSREHPSRLARLKVYPCWCGGYHIGHGRAEKGQASQ